MSEEMKDRRDEVLSLAEAARAGDRGVFGEKAEILRQLKDECHERHK